MLPFTANRCSDPGPIPIELFQVKMRTFSVMLNAKHMLSVKHLSSELTNG
jgi:hypothetical protein